MSLVSLRCPSCGADLPPREHTGEAVCDYCNSRFQVGQARAAHTVAGVSIDPRELARAIVEAQQQQQQQAQQRMQQQMHAQAQQQMVNYGPGHMPGQHVAHHHYSQNVESAARTGRRVILGVSVLTLVGAAAPAVIIAAQSGAFEDMPALGSIAESVEHLLWDHFAGPPTMVSIGGKDAFIGRTRKVLDNDQLFIDAYDARTVERIWRVGPLGSYSEAYQNTLFAVAGDRLAISDGKAQVHIHELESGELVQTIKLTDKAKQFCPMPEDGTSQVWLGQIDEKELVLDLKDGKLVEGPKPEDCADSIHAMRRRALRSGEDEGFLQVEGVEVKAAFVDGEQGVALGVKSPGTPVPRAVGFDPSSKEVRWNEVIASVDAASVRREDMLGGLAGGRVVVTYGAGQEDWYLASFDANNGSRIWETKLRPLFAVDSLNGVTVTDKYVLLGRTSSLEVFDASDGSLLGTVGKETYD